MGGVFNTNGFQTVSSHKTKYKYVTEKKILLAGRPATRYVAAKTIKGRKVYLTADTAEDAARELDIQLIKAGLEPINILKKKQ